MDSPRLAPPASATIADRPLPGGAWVSAWALLVAGLIAALLIRSCAVAPAAPPPAGFDPDVTARTVNDRAMLMLENLDSRSSPAMVLAAANLVVLNFASGSATIPASAELPLARVAEVMWFLPEGVRLEIAGHTDSVGAPVANAKLGRARANAVRDFLIQHGFPAERIAVLSYGDTRPIADNRSEEGRFRNRRIEFSLAL